MTHRYPYLILWLVALLLGSVAMTVSAQAPDGESWVVQRPIDIANMERGPNRVSNPGFELGAANWTYYGTRYVLDETVAHSGSRSVRIPSGALGAAVQEVRLNQTSARPIYISGWSKASAMPTNCRMQYSLYVDIFHTDGSQAESQYVCFNGGTHDWQAVDKVIFPAKPVATIQVWTMSQSASPGQAWFDDVAVGEYTGDIREFDAGRILYGAPAQRPWEGSPVLRVGSGDGLSLGLTANGGAVASLQINGQEQVDAANLHAGGFYVRDVAAGSAFIHLGGAVTQSGANLVYNGQDEALGLSLTATFRPGGNHLIIDANLQDTTGADRAISLYFALPIDPAGRTWWQDIRSSSPAGATAEQRFALATDWGANGYMSHYCLSDLTGPTGLALAYPMDRPVVSRFAYNGATHQYFVVSELGLSPAAQNPGRADVRLLLYHHDPAWGFRAAFAKYVQIFPQFFADRVAQDGVWVAHADLNGIPNIQDFHIRFHESGNSKVYPYDDSVNAYTLRYLTEPWGYWLRLPQNVPNTDYNAVLNHVRGMLNASVANERRWGNAILGSGTFDANGRYRYEAADETFAAHSAAFILNGDPELDVPPYTTNKAQQAWNDSIKEPYRHPEWGTLDGEYIDSFESRGLNSNFRAEHFRFSDLPLTYDKTSKRIILPQLFSNYELAKWIADDVHGLGKYVMANSTLLRWAFPAHLFDIMGSERGWVYNGQFNPESDSLLNLWRTFSYRKPYCVLQTGDLPAFTHAMVEQYFQVCAFYGIYPSFFTHDGGTTNYWNKPEWYERDRDLHARYIPQIEALNQAGWEPVTRARTNNSQVYIERYGSTSPFFLTLRNVAPSNIQTTVTVDLAGLGLPISDNYAVQEWVTNSEVATSLVNGQLSLTLTVPAKSTRLLRLEAGRAPLYTYQLAAGWNLVTLPGNPLSNRTSDVFESLNGQFDRLYAYDAARQDWISYDPQVPNAQELSEVQPGQGLWVHMLASATWRLYGTPISDISISLQPGWNLIGYPLGSTIEITRAVPALGDTLQIIYAYHPNPLGQPWRTFTTDTPPQQNSLTLFEPWQGYWVQMREAGALRLPPVGDAPAATATPTDTPGITPSATATHTPEAGPSPTETAADATSPTATSTTTAPATPTPVPPTTTATPTTSSASPTPTTTPPVTPTHQALRLNPAADTSLNQWTPTEARGYTPRLLLRQDDICAALLRFDLASLPPGTTIQQATLNVYVASRTNTNPLTISAYGVRRPWNEAETTWNRARLNEPWATAGCNGAADREQTAVRSVTLNNQVVWFSLDITPLVQGWVNDPATNQGLTLKGGAGNAVLYELAAREFGSDKQPYLSVRY